MLTDQRRIPLSFFLWGAGEGFFLYIWPLYLVALGAGAVQVGLVYALGSAVAAAINLPAGLFADRVGHRSLIRLTMLASLPVPIIYAFAPTWVYALPGVILYYLSFAMLPAMNSYLTTLHGGDLLPHDGGGAHVGPIGSTYAFFSLGLVTTPWLGGQIAVHIGIRWIFAPAVLCFVAGCLIIWQISDRSPAQHRDDAVPIRHALGGLRASTGFLVVCAYTGLMALAVGLTLPFAAPYAQHAAHVGDDWIGVLGSCVAAGEFVLGLALGRLTRRLGNEGALMLMLSLCVLFFLGLLVFSSPFALLPVFLLRGGFMTALSALTGKVGQTLSPSLLGSGFGVFETIFQSALVVASFVGGLLYAYTPAAPFVTAIAGLVLCLAIVPFLQPLWTANYT